MTPSEHWFGDHFSVLHPLLQQLHREGGRLVGEVDYVLAGAGVAAWFAQRIARGINLPAKSGRYLFAVDVSHTHDALVWTREFDGMPTVSHFRPAGNYPDGHWCERFGALEARLGVAIDEGGWRWLVRSICWHGVPVPLWCVPQSNAAKRITPAGYEFKVELVMPWLGSLIRYQGILRANQD